MKKILALFFTLSLMTSMSLAANSFGSAVKNAVKQDVANTKSAIKADAASVKKAVKQDIANTKQAQTSTAAAKKAEKIKQIDSKLAELNKEMAATKADKNITETERTLKARTLQRQIDFYNSQKNSNFFVSNYIHIFSVYLSNNHNIHLNSFFQK